METPLRAIIARLGLGANVSEDAIYPMTMRIEPIDPQHPQTVALLFGPLVLFAITDAQPVLTRAELLAASRPDQQTWQIKTANGPIKMLPFTAIDEEQYSTYLLVT